MASGVTVSDVCKTTYEEIKKDKKHRYVIFYIRDEKQIDVETVGDRNAEYDQFLEDIQKCGPGECRYGLFDFEYMHQCQGTSESSKKQKLFLMSWCPDTAKVKKKMLYSSSFDALKNLWWVYKNIFRPLTSLKLPGKQLKKNCAPQIVNKYTVFYFFVSSVEIKK
ncbi:unnamed protein product [Ceratitis capitata]|uniref:(Mediterranean fruit fly) hypothetical protein n=1 Tax=Ceratitis capitata TaxID=7213 RepID=A0A811VCE2_CERCA|nr:unnamed protein product [Ceratitis capitata]